MSIRLATRVTACVLPRQRYYVGWVERGDPEFDVCSIEDTGQASLDSAIRHAEGCARINPAYVFFVFDDDDDYDPIKYRTDDFARKEGK